MNGINTKINALLKRLLQQKGQSLTEFALILGFCVVIGWAANEVGILDAIGAVFEGGTRPPQEVAAIGGGKDSGSSTNPTDPTDPANPTDPTNPTNPTDPTAPGVGLSGFEWGTIDPNKYFEKEYKDENASANGGDSTIDFTVDESQADRLAADRKALENIARFFIGKTKGYVIENLLKEQYIDKADMGAGNPKDKLVLNIGHFKVANTTTKGPGMYFEVTNNDGLQASQAENIFKWMVDPYDPDSVVVKDNYNYLVSDYVVSQGWVDSINAGNQQGNGTKLRLEFDYAGQYAPEGGYKNDDDVIVIGAHVVIDPKSQFNDQLGKNKNYNRMTSQGLDVQVRVVGVDDKGELLVQVDHNNTGIPINASGNSVTGSPYLGVYNWYGESDYQLVQKYFNTQAKYTLGEENQEVHVERGNIVKKGDDWYIALNTATLTLNKNSTMPNNFVMIQRTDTWKYWHENDKTSDGPQTKTIKARGIVFTKDNGDVYVYVGTKTSGTVNIVTDINESNADWIKVGNLNESSSQSEGQG